MFHKEKGLLPDILDYGIATDRPVPIRDYDFDLKNNLDYGGSEGIYLDLWMEYPEDGERHRSRLGTFKTLDDSREAMRTMAVLPEGMPQAGTCSGKEPEGYGELFVFVPEKAATDLFID